MYNFRVWKCGDFYKVYLLNKNCPVPKDLIEKYEKLYSLKINQSNTSKLYNNLIRAKTNISNLILSNNFKYFITLTINNNHDRYNLDYFRTSFQKTISNLNTRYNKNIFFLVIPEEHKKGGFHFHGLLGGDIEDLIYRNQNGYLSLKCFDYLGFSNIQKIDSLEKVSSYITKYITKDFLYREKGKHVYFCSQGLNRPLLIDSLELNDYLDNEFFDYSNDYCKIKILKDYKNITNYKNLLKRFIN